MNPMRSVRWSRQKLWALAIGLVVILVAASGCQGGASTAGGGTRVNGGTINAALSGDPQTLDMAQNSGSLTIRVGTNIFEQLFAPDESYVAQPMLAEGYDKSADGLTYTITLRSGVKFHDGSTMTSADVVASLQRWFEVSGTGKLVANDVASLTASDEKTVVITLKQARYSLIDDLAYNVQGAIVVPAAVASSAGTAPIPDDQIIGTGPFKLESYQHGQSVTLAKFADYSAVDAPTSGLAGAKVANVDKIVFSFVTDPSQQLNGLKAGQYQWAMAVSPDEYPNLKDDPMISAQVAPTGLIATILLNHNASSPFSQLAARQGLNQLVDKKAIAQASFGPEQFWTPLDGAMVLPIDKPMYSEAGKSVYESFDETKAKELLTQAGVDASKPIRIFTTQTYPKYYQMAVVLQSQLEKIGLKADVQVYDFPTMIEKLSSDPTGWDISFTAFSGTVTSPAQVLPLTPTWPGEYSSTELDGLMAKYNAAQSADEAKSVVDEIQQLVWDDIPMITVAPNLTFLTWSKSLQEVSTFSQGIFWNCYLTK